jgi:hypothetical protein
MDGFSTEPDVLLDETTFLLPPVFKTATLAMEGKSDGHAIWRKKW